MTKSVEDMSWTQNHEIKENFLSQMKIKWLIKKKKITSKWGKLPYVPIHSGAPEVTHARAILWQIAQLKLNSLLQQPKRMSQSTTFTTMHCTIRPQLIIRVTPIMKFSVIFNYQTRKSKTHQSSQILFWIQILVTK